MFFYFAFLQIGQSVSAKAIAYNSAPNTIEELKQQFQLSIDFETDSYGKSLLEDLSDALNSIESSEKTVEVRIKLADEVGSADIGIILVPDKTEFQVDITNLKDKVILFTCSGPSSAIYLFSDVTDMKNSGNIFFTDLPLVTINVSVDTIATQGRVETTGYPILNPRNLVTSETDVLRNGNIWEGTNKIYAYERDVRSVVIVDNGCYLNADPNTYIENVTSHLIGPEQLVESELLVRTGAIA
ncbi:hypothetical protein GPJ56_000618 [Histomonas meleagridis]|uniref:uncharacterized protein n=1 Tax=Histomonas meleagridis TaxID=135588 RepID=UPI00355AC822|nr:hypothetical protein GPJ56_000618 [Histomonas meleagridis]KAH0804745.1 hypothetical protein GO595_002439 [Histomonas meleagridis]